MKTQKCSRCNKPAVVLVRKKVGYTAVCTKHYVMLKENREKRREGKVNEIQ